MGYAGGVHRSPATVSRFMPIDTDINGFSDIKLINCGGLIGSLLSFSVVPSR